MVDVKCKSCGLTRHAARSEVFARLLHWAADDGHRAIVVAAGNDAYPQVAYPAAYQLAIPVAALDQSGTALWTESNWDGSGQLKVLAVPGEAVATSSGTSHSGTSYAVGYAAALYAVAMDRLGQTMADDVTTYLTKSGNSVSNADVPWMADPPPQSPNQTAQPPPPQPSIAQQRQELLNELARAHKSKWNKDE